MLHNIAADRVYNRSIPRGREVVTHAVSLHWRNVNQVEAAAASADMLSQQASRGEFKEVTVHM